MEIGSTEKQRIFAKLHRKHKKFRYALLIFEHLRISLIYLIKLKDDIKKNIP